MKRFLILAAALVGLAGTVRVCTRGHGSSVAAATVDVSYRHALNGPDEVADLPATIAALEARVATMAPSPYDAADLAEAYYTRAQVSGDRADFATAERYATQSLALLAKPNGARLTYAKLLAARHQFHAAIDQANLQLETKDSAGPHVVIATAELAMGDVAAARIAIDRALAVRKDTTGYLTRALIDEAAGRDADAARAFADAKRVEVGGDRAGAAHLRALWGRFYVRRGEYANARAAIDESLRVAPNNALALATRGELLLRSGSAREALVAFQRAYDGSKQIRYMLDQARAREMMGERAQADSLRRQVEVLARKEVASDPYGHAIDLVEVLVELGSRSEIEEAVAVGNAELGRRASWEIRYQVARARYRAGDGEGARVLVEAMLESGTREAQVYELAARVEGEREEEFRRKADEIDPARKGWRAIGL